MHQVAERHARRFMALADRLFGSRLAGFYVVGSAALGGYLPDRSDLDFIAVIDRPEEADHRRIRLAQLASGARTGVPALLRGRTAGPGSCNGVYVAADQLHLPVTQITPIASHHGVSFERGSAFDVNPVVWKTFAEHGVALRGPEPAELGLDHEPHLLRRWNLENLNSYWKSCATAAINGRPPLRPWMPVRWATAWIVLGPARLHHRSQLAGSSPNSRQASTPWQPSLGSGIRSSWRHSPTGTAGQPIRPSPTTRHATGVPASSHSM